MNVKFLFYGTASIITTIITISALGVTQNLIKEFSSNLSSMGINLQPEITSMINTFCTKDSDCKQDPNNCNNCVNLLEGGLTLYNKCDLNKIPCACIKNKCTIKN